MLHKARKSRVSLFFVVLALGSLYLTSSASSIQAQTSAPNIAFLNPSGFAATGTNAGIIVSDTAPNKPEGSNATYRLSAWVSSVPSDAIVEFDIQQVQALPGGVAATVEATRVLGGNTFEADWSIDDTWPNGSYQAEVTLYSGGREADKATVDFTLRNPAPKPHIAYPSAEAGDAAMGRWGTFYPLGTGTTTERGPRGRVDVNYTNEERGTATTYVKTFYSTSTPGSNPNWSECGTEKTASHPSVPNGQAADGIRCRLNSATEQARVTAIAAVANSSGGSFEKALNGAGDVARVTTAYAQQAAKIVFTEGNGEKQDLNDADDYECHTVEVSLVDQFQVDVLGANIDVHAWGPGDNLWFDTGSSPPAGVQVPDRGTHARETGFDCFSRTRNDPPAGPQAEHNVTGAGADLKHVESTGPGTDDSGRWAFAMKPAVEDAGGSNHTTQIVVWVDEQNDGRNINNDTLDQGEAALCGSVGFGGSPDPPVGMPVISLDACTGEGSTQPAPTISPSASASSSPSTSPSSEPTAPPSERADRSISLSGERLRGERFAFSGRVKSEERGCVQNKQIWLQRRTLDDRWKTVQETRSDVEGNYRMTRRVGRKTKFRTMTPATRECVRAVSSSLTVRPRAG